MTGQLREADHVAGGAVAPVADLLAPVQGAGEQPATQKSAEVFQLNTAQLATLVFTTRSLLLTSLATSGIVCTGGQLHAWQLLVHVATPAPHAGGEGAGWTGPRVAGSGTSMGGGGWTTGETLTTCHTAQGDRIQAVVPGVETFTGVELVQSVLTAGAVSDQVNCEGAGMTLS